MLTELRVRDFAIIDALDLEFAPGLNVLTGETGAGKSIIMDCIALLMGDKAEANMVRAGAQAAIVEGTFAYDKGLRKDVEGVLKEHGLESEDGSHVTLSREVRAGGRSICRINGRSVNQSALKEIGELLVDMHGQSEHLSLLRVREHVNLLDRYAGTWELRQRVAEKYAELRGVRKQLEDIQRNERERARRLDMLKFQVEEIRAAKLKAGEEDQLEEEHRRLANAEALSAYTDEAYGALYEGSRDTPATLDQIATAIRALINLERFDPQVAEQHKLLSEANAVIEEVARTLRDYRDGIEFNPKRLQQVEDRLEQLKKLKRKYGESVEAVMAFGAQAETELDQIENAGEHIERLQLQITELLTRLTELATDLSKKRQSAAKKLAKSVEAELNDLRMSGARFEACFTPQEPDATGTDRVEFMIAPNVGEGLKPMVKVASGGETARLMLALKATLSHADSTPTLIFDEIDQGIGGRVGTTVGEKLWGLAKAHQVLCITHLPQLASFGDAHYKVEKLAIDGRTSTAVRKLDRKTRVDELSMMLGTTGKTGVQGAEQLLKEADMHKGNGK
jgi:DNA repair protein RecN (Recombination protein N)